MIFKRLRMAWCALRGGHVVTFKRFEYSRDILVDCRRCPWSALLAGNSQYLRGKQYTGFHIDEAEPTRRRGGAWNLPKIGDK